MSLTDSRANRRGLADQVRTLIRRAHELADGLDRETFNRRPPDGGWSVAECLDHLNATVRLYLPVLTQAMDDARARGQVAANVDGRTWLGRVMAWSQEPPVRLRMRTPTDLEPERDLEPGSVLEEFDILHEELIVRINESGTLDRKRIRIASVLKPIIKLSLSDWFSFLAAHARRHLWQAEQTLARVRG